MYDDDGDKCFDSRLLLFYFIVSFAFHSIIVLFYSLVVMVPVGCAMFPQWRYYIITYLLRPISWIALLELEQYCRPFSNLSATIWQTLVKYYFHCIIGVKIKENNFASHGPTSYLTDSCILSMACLTALCSFLSGKFFSCARFPAGAVKNENKSTNSTFMNESYVYVDGNAVKELA